MDKSVAKELTHIEFQLNGIGKNSIGEAGSNAMLLETVTPTINEEQLVFRPTTMADVNEAVDMFSTCSFHMIGQNEVSLADVRSEWLLPEFDLATATRVVLTPEGKIVGYIEVWDIDDTPVRIWVWGRVHPDYEGNGIGSQLMTWAEERARQSLTRVPDGIQVVLQSGSYNNYHPAKRLLAERGMSQIRSFYTMAIEFDRQPLEPSIPPGLSIRSMTNEKELRAVVRAVEDAFKDHWGHVEQPFEQEYQRWLHFIHNDENYDPSLWFLAVDGDEIAGVSLCNPKSNMDPQMGWVSTLGVRRPWRRQGLGLALLHHSFNELYQRGKARAGLGVDAGSLTGATRLYERAGMKPIQEFDTYELVLRSGRDISTQSVQ